MITSYTPEQAAEECCTVSPVRMVFSRPCKACPEKKIRIRKILLKEKDYYHIETFRQHQVFQKNIEPDALQAELVPYFSCFRSAECRGSAGTLFFLQNNKGRIALTKRVLPEEAPPPTGEHTPHNKTKTSLIPEGRPPAFLTAQGVMNADGTVLKKKYHKFRQINKFLEFIAGTEPFIREHIARTGLPFPIIDFGCGKAYLSFALYYYLHETQGLPVRIHGLDLKTEVVAQCADLAQECGYEHLTFAQGDIAAYPIPEGTGMMVCLHACNTATDLALAQAVRQQVPVIFAVPCCQHELYAQLKAHTPSFRAAGQVLLPFMEHGIITERFASLLTDTVRALLLQASGYTVRIMEFIETEHTPKNLLIHAVKKSLSPAQERQLKADALKKYRSIKEAFLIEPFLETVLELG